MKKELIEIGMKVVPHKKSVSGYGDLDGSVNWREAKEKRQPYLFVTDFSNNIVVLNIEKGISRSGGDYFLPEDFESYAEEEEGVKKSDLNSSMVYKLRNLGLCVLLDKKSNKEQAFYNKNSIEGGYSGGLAELITYDSMLKNRYGEDYDVVAFKQYSDCVKALSIVLNNKEPEEWDWVEDVEK